MVTPRRLVEPESIIDICGALAGRNICRPSRTRTRAKRVFTIPLSARSDHAVQRSGNCGFYVEGESIEYRNIGPVLLIDQQRDFGAAQDDALGAARTERVDGIQISRFAGGGENSAAKLIENNAIEFILFGFGRDEDFNPELVTITALQIIQRHDGLGAEQGDTGEAGGTDRLGSGIGDVQEGNADRCSDAVSDAVQGVRNAEEQVRSGALQALSFVGKILSGFF